MNKIVSLLLAGFFLFGLIMVLAALLWFSDHSKTVSSQSADLISTPSFSENISLQTVLHPDAPLPSGYSLQCTILIPSGNPIRDAHVRVESIDDSSYRHASKTDLLGICNLLILQPGSYRITAEADGYSPMIDQIQINPNSDRKQFRTLALRPPLYTIRGQVLTHAGAPVVNATLTCTLKSISSASSESVLSSTQVVPSNASIENSTQTRRNGLFRFDSLVAGTYTISATQDGYLPGSSILPLHRDQQVSVRMDRTSRLRGTLTDAWKRPIANATVSIRCTDSSTLIDLDRTISTADGRFTFLGLPPREFAIHAVADGYQAVDQSIRIHESVHELESRRLDSRQIGRAHV